MDAETREAILGYLEMASDAADKAAAVAIAASLTGETVGELTAFSNYASDFHNEMASES